jgi:hypothetical protein
MEVIGEQTQEYSIDNPPQKLKISGAPYEEMNTTFELSDGETVLNSPVWRAENGSFIIASTIPANATSNAGNYCWGVVSNFFTISTKNRPDNFNPSNSNTQECWDDIAQEYVSISIEIINENETQE